MQMDLALYLRLARTLERSDCSVLALEERHADVLRSLDRFLLAVEERAELLRGHEAKPLPEMAEAEVIVTGETITGEVVAELVGVEELPNAWTSECDALYEDVMWLFRMQDFGGALSSVSRLLDVAADTQELRQFLDLNESKLLSAFERAIGPFDRPVSCQGVNLAEHYFYNPDDAETLLDIARNAGSVQAILDQSPLGKLQTLSMLYRFRNERILIIEGMELPAAIPGG